MFNLHGFREVINSELKFQNTAAYKRCSEKYSGLLDGADIRGSLAYAWFAFAKGKKLITAFIFDSASDCQKLIAGNPGYAMLNFKEFSEAVGSEWENPKNYFIDEENDLVIFHLEL